MPDLLLELFCEEIPARMQLLAKENLHKNLTNALIDHGLVYEGARSFVTPRRLSLHIAGLPAQSPERIEERKGPKINAPQKAIVGFLKAAGLNSVDDAIIQNDKKKGEFYLARKTIPGQNTDIILKSIIETLITTFPWPKSMRWGNGALKWVRPLQSILCSFGPETEDPVIIPVTCDHLTASNLTYGHRFMAPDPIQCRRLDDYMDAMEDNFVVLDSQRRCDIIANDSDHLAFAKGLEVVKDDALLQEVAGLVEWPVVLIGKFDEKFLNLPDNVIRSAIKTHQKCFVVNDPEKQHLSNAFIMVSNLKASDQGHAIIAGNERVVAARLSDAQFFYDADRQTALSDMAQKLQSITFHQKLGTQAQRLERISDLARYFASHNALSSLKVDPDHAQEAAMLCKADLTSQMVGEFPELQGQMGHYYALLQGYNKAIAASISEHYLPKGANDQCAEKPLSIVIALADKMDILAGFWIIGEKPTGSKDPFALRRAALGVLQTILHNALPLPLSTLIAQAITNHNAHGITPKTLDRDAIEKDLALFFIERLKVQLRDQGFQHAQIDAVLTPAIEQPLPMLVKCLQALSDFLGTDQGQFFMNGYKRINNMMKSTASQAHNLSQIELEDLHNQYDKALAKALRQAENEIAAALEGNDFQAACNGLASLAQPIDAFFEHVLVNDDDKKLRSQRYALLSGVQSLCAQIADFSKLSG
jgi:glycyl-tRNA synthetase beta chain